ncbi:MAG: PLP-dependent aminotransferase family protein, partial [Acidobacteriota bacterium]
YDGLRDALLRGAIPAGHRLPSTRTLASDLGLSRNTVTSAYDRLLDEGFIESRVGSGSFVSEALSGAGGRSAETAEEAEPSTPLLQTGTPADPEAALGRQHGLSTRGSRIMAQEQGRDPDRPRAFSVGVPALDEFPLSTWQRLAARRARQTAVSDLRHGPLRGNERLRRAIAFHLNTMRGVRCGPHQILMLPSAQLGLDLVGRLLLAPGDAAWIEDPGYLGARGALVGAGARLVPVPVDGKGLEVDVGAGLEARARLAYVTPSHQFPLGVSMTLKRRLALLAWAESTGAWILEDDYDSEYRYAGRSTQALQGLDRSGRVLYLGTFSKVLFPALRLAYLVVPEELIEPFEIGRFLADGHVPRAPQEVLADFMEAGHLVAHLRRMRDLYRERRDLLLDQLKRRFGSALEISGQNAGMHLAARWSEDRSFDDRRVARAAAGVGLDLAPLSRYVLDGRRARSVQGLTFGYCHVPPREIVAACELLEGVLG